MKMHLKRIRKIRVKKRIHHKLIIIIIISLVSSFLLIYYLSKKVTPNIVDYATIETKKIITVIVNRAVTKQAAESLEVKNLVTTTTNQNGKIVGVDFNPYMVNKTLSTLASTIQINLKRLEQGKVDLIELPDDIEIEEDKKKLQKGIIYEVPLGMAFNNSLLANIGPKIPIKLSLVGDIEANFKSTIKDYGINNALLKLVVNVKITERVLLPITSKEITVETDIPVAIKLIEGDVPEYYSGSSSSSKISVPIDSVDND